MADDDTSQPQPAPIDALHWQLQRFDALAPAQLYALLRLRAEIFVVEQACAYLDPDGRDCDPGARHLLGFGGRPHAAAGTTDAVPLLAYCRLLPPGSAFDAPSIGRVVVASQARGRGLGHRLLEQAIVHCHALWPGAALMLGAQQHLTALYASHGFVVASDMYLEDGIPHVDMRREGG